MSKTNSCAVAGAGIIGICCGISLLEKGFQVTLYDPNPPGSQTSSGNAGGFGFTDVMPMASPGILWKAPAWLFDPCGPLFIRPGYFPKLMPWLWDFYKSSSLKEVEKLSKILSELLESSKIDTRKLLTKAGLTHLFTERGALTVYPSSKSFEAENLEWEIKRRRGVRFEVLEAGQIKDREPELKNVQYGRFTPDWCNTVEPYILTRRLAEYFVGQGGRIEQAEVLGFKRVSDAGDIKAIKLSDSRREAVDQLIIAAGAWSKRFCDLAGDRILIESERGYNTTLANPGVNLYHQIIFGEEKFVITNIDGGLRIGGAAEFAGLKSPPNYKRSRKLVDIARRYLPNLQDGDAKQWMGHRPSTPDSIPVISKSSGIENLYYAFGHGHYGLTMAATTGKAIASMVASEHCSFDAHALSISRFQQLTASHR